MLAKRVLPRFSGSLENGRNGITAPLDHIGRPGSRRGLWGHWREGVLEKYDAWGEFSRQSAKASFAEQQGAGPVTLTYDARGRVGEASLGGDVLS
jgi:hypothetical protein